MNTNNLKKVAPRARTAFIKAITARAGELGITTCQRRPKTDPLWLISPIEK